MSYTDEEISRAARGLRREWESPQLWPRIRTSLAAEAARAERRRALFRAPAGMTAAAAAAVLALALTAVLRLRPPPAGIPPAEAQRRLLSENALRDVERTEADYVRSIEALARTAEPRVEEADSPLMMSYREKLLLLDGAIAECRARIDRNRFNARLRRELLSLYQQKERTLQQVVKEDAHAL